MSIIDRIRYARSPEQAELRRLREQSARTRPIRAPFDLADPMTMQVNRMIR